MTFKDVVDRTAYEIGDDRFELLTRDEYLKYLERAYRDLCEFTFILRGVLTLTCTASKRLDLYTTIESVVYGNDIKGIFYVKYTPVGSTTGAKAYERTFDDAEIDVLSVNSYGYGTVEHRTYTILRESEKVTMLWSHTPTAGDTVEIHYYRSPVPGSIVLTSEIPFSSVYHEDLVLGTTMKVLRRLYILATRGKKGMKPDDAKVYYYPYKEAKEDWKERLPVIRREVTSFLDDTIPLIMQIGSPFDMFDDEEQILMEDE